MEEEITLESLRKAQYEHLDAAKHIDFTFQICHEISGIKPSLKKDLEIKIQSLPDSERDKYISELNDMKKFLFSHYKTIHRVLEKHKPPSVKNHKIEQSYKDSYSELGFIVDDTMKIDGEDYELLWENGINDVESIECFIEGGRSEYSPDIDCPFCGNIDGNYVLKSKSRLGNRWSCRICRKRFSLTTGTFIENTKLSKEQLWRFCWLIGDFKMKPNSVLIGKQMKLSQQSAYGIIKSLNEAAESLKGLEIRSRYSVIDALMSLKHRSVVPVAVDLWK